MVKLKTLAQSLRQESLIAQYFGIGAFSLVPITIVLTSLQGRTESRDNSPEFLFMMLFGFLALAYGRLAQRMVQIAEACEADQEPTA